MASVSGIVSGLDTATIIDQLVAAASGPIKTIQRSASDYNIRKGKLQDLNTLLADFKAKLDDVNEVKDLPSYTATSSDDDRLGVSLSGDATPGVYTIDITQKATAALDQSNSFNAADETLQDGTLTVTVGTTVTSVTIDEATGTNTIEGLAAYLSNSVGGVSAYVLDTGAASNNYRLMIAGTDTGLENDVDLSISQTGATGSALTMSMIRDAQNAVATVDTVAISRSSNTLTDVLPGLTLEFKDDFTPGPLTVTVNRDAAAMSAKVTAVQTAYNKLTDYFDDNSGIDADPAIAGDQTFRAVQRRLRTILAAGYSNENIAGLNQLGIGSDQHGQLEFTSSDFESKLSSNWEDVLDLLTGTGGLFNELYTEVESQIDETTGLIQPRLDNIDDRIEALEGDLDAAQYRLDMYRSTLEMEFTAMELVLAGYQTTGDYLSLQIAQQSKAKG